MKSASAENAAMLAAEAAAYRGSSLVCREDIAVCAAATTTETATRARATAGRPTIRLFHHNRMFWESIDWGVFVCEASKEDAREVRRLVDGARISTECVVRSVQYGHDALRAPLHRLMYVAMSLRPPGAVMGAACELVRPELLVRMAALIDCKRMRGDILARVLASDREGKSELVVSLIREARCCVSGASALLLLRAGSVKMLSVMFREFPYESVIEFSRVFHLCIPNEITDYCDDMLYSLSEKWRARRRRGDGEAAIDRHTSPDSARSLV
jgi:hypothetical protein